MTNSGFIARTGDCPRARARFRVLIVGWGDVGQRLTRRIPSGVEVAVLVRDPAMAQRARDQGLVVFRGDLDQPETLRRLAGWPQAVVHLAPPPQSGAVDTRTRQLLRALGRGHAPKTLVYVSTTGVYGDCEGRWIDECAPLRAHTDRARRRVDAEQALRAWSRQRQVRLSVLRAPGIYAADREGHPRQRLLAQRPLLRAEEDVFTNHIHADDLARACWRALWVGRPMRAINVVDDSDRRMGEHFDAAADHLGLPRAPRRSRAELAQELSPMAMSFLSESRRIGNARLKRDLRFVLSYPVPELGW